MLKKILCVLICTVFVICGSQSVLADDRYTAGHTTVSSEADADSDNTIIGFRCVDSPMISMHYNSDDKPDLNSLLKELPQNITAKLITGEYIDIPVEWISASGDYDNTSYGYYSFYPVWDTDKYALSENVNRLIDIPYIGIFLENDISVSDNEGYYLDEKYSSYSVTGNSNETIIFNFLVENMYCNTATAVGILANIKCESSFDPSSSCVDTNGLTSYGICQWNGSRYNALKTYCKNNNLDYTSIYGQLYYLKYELNTSESSAWSNMQGIENTVDGAYIAGYRWAQYFERCAHYYQGIDQYATRGQLAMNTFWPEYQHLSGWTGITAANPSIPTQIWSGKAFVVTGKVYSDKPITSVVITVEDSTGKSYTSNSASPNTTSYDLRNLDAGVLFNILSPGIYKYRIKVTNAEKSEYVVDKSFVVLGKTASIEDGTYIIKSMVSSNFGVSDDDGNVVLEKLSSTPYQVWDIKYTSNGYYTVRNYNDLLYMAVSGAADSEGANVQALEKDGSTAQNWQILWTGAGYSLVPECAENKCLDLYETGGIINMAIYSTDMTPDQCFSFEKADCNFSDDAVTCEMVGRMTTEECIDFVNSFTAKSSDCIILTDAQLMAIERVLTYNYLSE